MNKYYVVKTKQKDGKWVNLAGVCAASKEEALEKAKVDVGFPVRVVLVSGAQNRKFARQAKQNRR